MADRTAIDALKAAARAKREAHGPEVAEAAPAAEPTRAPEPVVEGPLAQLGHAEALRESMRHSIVGCNAALAAYSGTPESAAEIQALVVALSGNVGKLQAAVDDVSVGDLEEGEVRDGARARRKALNATIEDELTPAVALLRKKTTPAALLAAVAA